MAYWGYFDVDWWVGYQARPMEDLLANRRLVRCQAAASSSSISRAPRYGVELLHGGGGRLFPVRFEAPVQGLDGLFRSAPGDRPFV